MADSDLETDLIRIGNMSNIPTKYAFEIEFLVSQNIAGYPYPDQTPYERERWDCPPDHPDARSRILTKVAKILANEDEPVHVLYRNGDEKVLNEHLDYHLDYRGAGHLIRWYVEDGWDATWKEGAAECYIWYPVRVRSPLFDEETWFERQSKAKLCIAALRRFLHIHVNSTCPLTVFAAPNTHNGLGPLDLNTAKKLVTLVWLLEGTVMRAVLPDIPGFGEERFISKHS